MASTDMNGYMRETGFGGNDGRTRFNEKEQRKSIGGASQWDDIIGSALGSSLYSTAGKVDYDWNENALTFQSGGDISVTADRIIWNIQKLHKVKEDSMLHYHIHFDKDSSDVNEFILQYRIQENGGIKTTAWATLTATTIPSNEVFTYTSGTLNQIVQFDPIDWSNVGISSTVNFRLARTDSLVGDVLVTFIDGHIEIDSDGSNQEYVK